MNKNKKSKCHSKIKNDWIYFWEKVSEFII